MIPSRRTFLKKSFLTTSFIALSSKELFALSTPLEILQVVQVDLFPQDMLENANAFKYLSIVLQHSYITQEEKDFLINGTGWLNETANTQYQQDYIHLEEKERQKVLRIITSESWGDGWIKTVLRYILEATLGDPLYGINKNESGWKWLAFEPGLPRPKEMLL